MTRSLLTGSQADAFSDARNRVRLATHPKKRHHNPGNLKGAGVANSDPTIKNVNERPRQDAEATEEM
ncbi:MAG: hypothetical protein MUC92_00450 [Fimbriimonadaceae bacterium]|jgi:hypothetical protein|nr:hypothetical protein [Fimbriimonadaceae bacterium]